MGDTPAPAYSVIVTAPGAITAFSSETIEKSLGLIFIYTPAGASIPPSVVINPDCLLAFSNTVAYTQDVTGPAESAFTINLSPCSTFLAFSPSSKKYA